MRRLLRGSKLVVFGEQNFPWNAPAGGHLVTESLGIEIVVRPMSDIRDACGRFSDEQVDRVWSKRRGRYVEKAVRPQELRQAVRTYLAIKEILAAERAMGFGVNCFGDLVIRGGRDVPCLAQCLLREDGYIASCDGDYLAMTSMALTTFFLDKTCMMSNMYPVRYVGALKEHFGDPLSPRKSAFPRKTWKDLARLGHCGWVGVVSPEMAPGGKVALNDWGGTYEIKRDGRGCGIDGDLAAGERITIVELKFDGSTLLVADGEVCETSRHAGMPHCESTALLKFRDLEGFVENISREHTVVVYGDHVADFQVLAEVLGLECKVF
jgi:L-fucose isomerase-like protein